MSKIKNILADTFAHVSRVHTRRRALRVLDELPDYIRDDIGWSGTRFVPTSPGR